MEDSKNTHPLILVAAVCVTLASLTAIAFFAGLLPLKKDASSLQATSVTLTSSTSNLLTSTTQTTVAPTPASPDNKPAPQPLSKKVQSHPKPPPTASLPPPREVIYETRYSRTRQYDDAPDYRPFHRDREDRRQTPFMATPPVCRECGTVESVHEISRKGEASGAGAVAGGVLGGVLGHQVGKGRGKDAATIVGVIGGALGGNHIEKNIRTEKQYQVTVRFDDGALRTYTENHPNWQAGQRVRSINGGLSPL